LTDQPSNAALLCEAGRLLFGPAWQSELARTLGVSLRRVQYYAADARQPPATMLAEVAGLLARRSDECRDMAQRLQNAAGVAPPA
jgi:hypothetical protein